MPVTNTRSDFIGGACLMLAVVQGVMLASLFFELQPHPPRAIALFAMPPFLAVSIGTALCAGMLSRKPAGTWLAALAALFALPSFGPQKYFDPAFGEIWIAVIASQAAVLTITYALLFQPAESAGNRAT